MRKTLLIFAALALLSPHKSVAQLPYPLEQYRRYLEQQRGTGVSGGVQRYQTPTIYPPETVVVAQPAPQAPKPAPPETLPYFDEPVVIEGETVQVIRKATPRVLRRYGEDLFANTTAVPFTAQLPVSEEYVLGSGDKLLLNLWGGVNGQYELTVDREGKIYIPQVGEVAVGGLKLSAAEAAVKRALQAVYSDFQASLSVAAVKTIRVFVVGQVKRPGVYDLPGLSRVMTALVAAGGPDSVGSYRDVKVYRGNRLVASLDVYEFIRRGKAAGNIQLAAGDVVVVPHYKVLVKLRGRVKTPAEYELLPGETIADLIRLCGGTLPDANTKAIFVDRLENGLHRSLTIDLTDSSQAKTPLEDGDDISIFPVNPYREKIVFVEGYVPQPGAYGWFEGMRVADLFKGDNALFDDTYLARANLLRLMGDGRYRLMPVDLGKALEGDSAANIPLKPHDRIQVFSKRRFLDKEYVAVGGAVRKPGRYELFEGMRVSDLVFLAGGLTKYAYPDSAELVRIIEGRETKLEVIPLGDILRNPSDPRNLKLQDDDYLFVRSVPKWRKNQFVTVLGEVNFPGNYALLSDDETLSHIIARAGGVTDEAFLEGAVFIRPRIAEEVARRNVLRVIRGTQQLTLDTLGRIDTTALIFNWNPADLNRVILDMEAILAGKDDIKMEPGDTIFIPRRPDGVSVTGAVASNGTVKYRKGKSVRYYIKRAGGLTRNADRSEIRLVKPNGRVLKVSLGFNDVSPGDIIVVPQRIKREVNWLASLRDVISILSGVATTVYILLKL